MATRIQKVKECDRAMCRRRKGVMLVNITIEVYSIDGMDTDEQEWRGELCPLHRQLAFDQATKLFTNKKEYDNGPDESDNTRSG